MGRAWHGLALAIGACGGDKDELPPADDAGDADTDADADSDADTDADADSDADADPGNPRVRMVHTSQGIGRVDVFFDMDPIPVGTFDPLTGSDWQRPAPGNHDFRVSLEGEGGPAAFATTSGPLDAGERYSLVVYGTSAPADGHAIVYREVGTGLGANQVRFAFMNAVPGTTVDVGDVALGAAASVGYPDRVALPDVPEGAYTIGIDWQADGTFECGFPVPDTGAGIVALYLVAEGPEARLLGQDTNANAMLIGAVEGTCPIVPAPGGTGDTGP